MKEKFMLLSSLLEPLASDVNKILTFRPNISSSEQIARNVQHDVYYRPNEDLAL